jgi:2'-5' RNA ligase
MNELAYSELILSMDTTTSGGKVAFNIIERSKTDKFPEGNSALAWNGLNSAPSLTKIHKQFYSAKLKRKVDPDTFIGYLEDLRTQMSDMDSEMTDDQFMIHVTNNLTKDYENTVDNLEGRIGNDENPVGHRRVERKTLSKVRTVEPQG